MRPASLARLMRAVCGDAVALAACANDEGDHDRLAALVLLDPEPHPLATLTAFAVTNDPPAALRARMRAVAPAALRALHDAQDDDLVAVLRFRLRTRDGGAVWAAMSNWESARIAQITARDARFAVDLLARICAGGWAATPLHVRTALLDAATRTPHAAMRALLALAAAPDDEARRLLLRAVVSSENGSRAVAQSLANGVAWRDATGWRRLRQTTNPMSTRRQSGAPSCIVCLTPSPHA